MMHILTGCWFVEGAWDPPAQNWVMFTYQKKRVET